MEGKKRRRGNEGHKSTSSNSSKKICRNNSSDSDNTKLDSTCGKKIDNINKGMFKEMVAFILPAGIENKRVEIFKTQIEKHGGIVLKDFSTDARVTHIIVDDKMDAGRMLRIMQMKESPMLPVIKSAWLSSCLRQKCVLPHNDHLLQFPKVDSDTDVKDKATNSGKLSNDFKPCSNSKNRSSDSDEKLRIVHSTEDNSDYAASDEESKDTIDSKLLGKAVPVEKWICAQSSKNPRPNCNKHITDKLEEMVKAYESTNDKWRAFGYQKAIQALKRHPKEISSWEEAMALPGVGKRLADKIWEIVESGELRKLNEFKSSEEVKILEIFTNVWGAGPTTAQQWYLQGFRSINDLKEKAHLNHQQKVGVRLYDDLLDRMPREEAGEIEKIVREAAESIQPGIIAQACGSYRRRKATCGDVDVLVTHPDGRSHKGVFAKLLAKLKETGFLTDDLVSAEETGNQKKYLGVCKLPGPDRKHRRLDIIVVPYSEYGCALVYFTGSAHFNRSLRHLCKKQNMSLNEHALKTGVVRKGTDKIYEGTVIPTPTEESVFTALKIPYRSPEERDH